MQESETELELMWELPPTGWRRLSDSRRKAIEQIITAAVSVVESVWEKELPSAKLEKARRKVGVGARKAVAILTLRNTSHQMADYWDSAWYLDAVPSYWEPAESNVDPQGLPEHRLAAYRWTAAIVCLHIRNALEDLHAAHISDDSMGAMNRSIRNAVYDILLGDIWLGYWLCHWPGALLKAKVRGAPVRIPNAAGAVTLAPA